jgi:hypothetical protein
MVFVGYLLFNRLYNPQLVSSFRKNISLANNAQDINNISKEEYRKSVMNVVLNYSFIAVFVLLTVVPAVLIALGCNTGHMAVVSGVIAFFFSDIYLFNYAFRKFVLNEPGYCKV